MVETTSNIFGKKYEIIKKLGQGGFATVYLAQDVTLGRKVAIKVLDAQLSEDDPTFLKRFEREAQTVAQLNHANIIDIYEFGQEKGRYFIVMPYLPGSDLGCLIRQQGALPVEQVIRITEQVASALDYAHGYGQGLIHRDVKPPNVILDEQGNAILMDFGIVKLADESTVLTQTGGMIGTPYYMAPEQWATGQMDARTDLYALGVMVYQMLTGQVPFSGQTPPRIMYAHLNETPSPPQTLNPTLPPAVEKVLLRILAKSPAQRYQTAGQFCADLQAALTGRFVEDETQVGQYKQKTRSLPKAIWFGGLALLAVLIVGGLFLFSGEDTPAPAPVLSIEEAKVELDGLATAEDFQQVACGASHRMEIKLLDSDHARIQPESFSYNWRFEPEDPNNEDSLSSGNYALIYQVPCELNNQMITVEVQDGDKTLYTKSVHFNISQ